MSYPNYGAGQNYPPYMGQQPPNPSMGYPAFSGYDNSSMAYSAQPSGTPGVIGFNLGMPNQSAYPQAGGYPPQQGGYPPQQGGYPPPQQGGYPPQQGGYPPQQLGASSPPQQQGSYPSASPKLQRPPQQQSSYPTQGTGQSKPLKEEGTLKPYPGFNAETDAQILRKAMKGFGTDEKAIIDVLGNRSNAQRQEIVKMFKTACGKDLVKELKGELSGKFEKAILGLLYTPAMYGAVELKHAMKGLGTDEEVLIEIMCSRTNREIMEMSDCFKQITGKSLENWLKSETSGHFCRLLVSLSTAGRSEDQNVNQQAAEMDAKRLYEAGENQWGTDESQFNAILASRSYPQLKAIFDAYKRLYNHDLQKAISSEMSGDLKTGMLSLVKFVQNKHGYFAEQLYKSMKGAGTDDSTLIRVIISRCEIDMKQIKQEFQKMYGQTLEDFIRGDCSGDYERILLRLVGGGS